MHQYKREWPPRGCRTLVSIQIHKIWASRHNWSYYLPKAYQVGVQQVIWETNRDGSPCLNSLAESNKQKTYQYQPSSWVVPFDFMWRYMGYVDLFNAAWQWMHISTVSHKNSPLVMGAGHLYPSNSTRFGLWETYNPSKHHWHGHGPSTNTDKC